MIFNYKFEKYYQTNLRFYTSYQVFVVSNSNYNIKYRESNSNHFSISSKQTKECKSQHVRLGNKTVEFK